MKAKIWLATFCCTVFFALGIIGITVYSVDPFFHYHSPNTDKYYYTLNNQRSQNDGISKHFTYNALITGTSMTENFKTSEIDSVFGVNSIKIPYSGATYKEINDSLTRALESNPNLKTIVRGLDMSMFIDSSERMRLDLGAYPTYLYDNNPFNDVKYLFNKNILCERVCPMIINSKSANFQPGITSFDAYSNWQASCKFGIASVYPKGITINEPKTAVHLTDAEKQMLEENITKNVTSLAKEYPDVNFYYFFTPYSIAFWKEHVDNGTIYQLLEAEKCIIELILECDNNKLYSFNNCTDIITNLNHYKDTIHYGQWINSAILKWMHDEKYILTTENYLDYLESERLFYTNYDYSSLDKQEDYTCDLYAAYLLYCETNNAQPYSLLDSIDNIELMNASIVQNQYNSTTGIECIGSLAKAPHSEMSVADYLMTTEYIGCKLTLPEKIDKYKYLVFHGRQNTPHGQPCVYLYNNQNEVIAEYTSTIYSDLDSEWHPYVIDISNIKGDITIIFNGGYIDCTGSEQSSFTFSNIYLH